MKLLCFSDLHRDVTAAAQLVAASANVDCLIGAGDFATCRQGIQDVIEVLSAVDKPAVLVPGNGESFDELVAACAGWKSARVLHGSGVDVDGIEFWGVGGGIPVTPFGDWSYDFDEQQASSLLADCPTGGVLVVHSPPFDTVDRDTGGQLRGSESIRAAVDAKQPRLVVCGHIHSEWGHRVTLGPSLVLNAGPRGTVIDLT